MAKRLCITIDGMAYHAVMQDNPPAEAIAAMCPFTVSFTRSGDHEYYSSLTKKVTAKDSPSTTKGHRNGLYYFEGWNAVSFVFKDCDTAPYQINHIGDFEEDVSAALEKAGKTVKVTCEAE